MPALYARLKGDLSSNASTLQCRPHAHTVTIERLTKTNTPDKALIAVAVLGVLLALVSLTLQYGSVIMPFNERQLVFLAVDFGSKYKATFISGICIAFLCLCHNIAGVVTGKTGTKASTASFAFICALNGVLALATFSVYSFILSDCTNNRKGNICGERLSIWPILLTALAICSLMQLVFAIIGAVFSCKPQVHWGLSIWRPRPGDRRPTFHFLFQKID